MNRDYRDRVRIMARRQELERDPARAAAAIIITVAVMFPVTVILAA